MRKFLLLALSLALPACAQTGIRFDASVTTAATNAPPGSQAVVLTEPNSLITICSYPPSPTGGVCTNVVPVYADQALTQVVSQPLQADGAGRFGFWISPGTYSYSVQSSRGSYVGNYTFTLSSSTTAKATSSTYGTVELAQGATNATLSKIASSGQASDIQGLGKYVILNCSGELGACLSAADTANAGTAATFALFGYTGSLTAPLTLGAMHSVQCTNCTIAWGAAITPTTDNTFKCFGSTILTQTATNTPSPQYSPFFAALSGAAEVERFTVRGCHFEYGVGAYTGEVLYSSGPTQDVTIADNYLHNVQAYMQQGSPASNPSYRLMGHHNTVVWDNGQGQQAAAFLIYGGMVGSIIDANTFQDVSSGAEYYFNDASGVYGPLITYAAAQVSGQHDNIFANNNCYNMGYTCAWGSDMYRVSFVGNTANGCGDVCFDAEGSAEVLMAGNSCKNGANGCFTEFYTGFSNTIRGNHISGNGGESAFSIRNNTGDVKSQQGLTIADNTLACGPTTVCAIGYFEPNKGTTFQGNQFFNAEFTGGGFAGGYSSLSIIGNHFTWTIPNPYGFTIFGAASGVGAPDVPITTLIKDNIIDGSFLQNSGSTCLNATSTDYNFQDTYLFSGNTCMGGWTVDASVTNNSGNSSGGANPTGVTGSFVFHMNSFTDDTSSGGTITATTTSGQVAPVLIHSGNYGQTGTTPF